MLYTLRFFSSKCSLFHNANLFGSCIIHILYTICAKIKKNYSGAKGLMLGVKEINDMTREAKKKGRKCTATNILVLKLEGKISR